jgi:prepilin-type N-terminal cleavage/methylation domain-containing protein
MAPMQSAPPAARQQRGFTLVEMSITLAVAGLLFAAVASGQELIGQVKAQKLLSDLKSVETQVLQYAQVKGRWPGDCDADGLIDFAADAVTRADTDNATRAAEYAYSTGLPTIPGDGTAALAETDGCALNGGATATVDKSSSNANVWINDLKLAGLISDSMPSRTFAKSANEDFLFVGKVTDASAGSADGTDYNAIVMHNVPQWMARRLATAVNGQDARADRSRLRLLARPDADGTYATSWSDTTGLAPGDMGDSMVSVAYFFDRIPAAQ